MSDKYMYVEMLKEWGGFSIGDVVRFGWNKGEGRITAGEGRKVKKQKAVNGPEPQVETAMMKRAAEADAKAKAKAEADAEAKAKAEAEAKAKAEAEAKAKDKPDKKDGPKTK